MVVVVAAVSKASSGRAWQSSSSYLSIYSLYYAKKNSFSCVFFWCVFGELFLARDFFFSFFCTFFVKNTTNTFDFRQTHTIKQRSAEVVVCVCACLWCDCRLKGTI